MFEINFGAVDPPVVFEAILKATSPASNNSTVPRVIECSSFVWHDGYLLISSDRHDHGIFTYPLDLDKMALGEPRYHVLLNNEQELFRDAEAITIRKQNDGRIYVYTQCSLSNNRYEMPQPARRLMMRFALKQLDPFTAEDVVVFSTTKFREEVDVHFKTIGVPPYYCFIQEFPGSNKNTYRWGAVEGIAFAPNSSILLCGMRNPQFKNNAIIFSVKGLDDAIDFLNPDRMEVIDFFTLDLGGRGFSDISWDPVTKGFLITSGISNGPKLDSDKPYPPDNLDSALFWWSGRKDEQPILFAKMPDLSVEAICRLGNSRFVAIGSDEGDESEGRNKLQSVLTIIDFTGLPATNKE
ncbi:MAG: hypothetical protein E4H40_07630 [Candidatus Brocadiia bacterium]|nr:MAG: hypothetical protein E4H40_07630 [Candidatus Brocadiia bacterium]